MAIAENMLNVSLCFSLLNQSALRLNHNPPFTFTLTLLTCARIGERLFKISVLYVKKLSLNMTEHVQEHCFIRQKAYIAPKYYFNLRRWRNWQNMTLSAMTTAGVHAKTWNNTENPWQKIVKATKRPNKLELIQGWDTSSNETNGMWQRRE